MPWRMPTQPWCSETSWVYLGSTSDVEGGEADCDGDQDQFSCLQLTFTIIPFQVGFAHNISVSVPLVCNSLEEGQAWSSMYRSLQ